MHVKNSYKHENCKESEATLRVRHFGQREEGGKPRIGFRRENGDLQAAEEELNTRQDITPG